MHALFRAGLRTGEMYNDVWVFDLDLNRWSRPVVSGQPPTPRWGHTASLVSPHIILLLGGREGSKPMALNEFYTLNLKTMHWRFYELPKPAPKSRYAHTAVWMPGSRNLLMFGGHGGRSRYYNDLQILQMPLQPGAPTAATAPSPIPANGGGLLASLLPQSWLRGFHQRDPADFDPRSSLSTASGGHPSQFSGGGAGGVMPGPGSSSIASASIHSHATSSSGGPMSVYSAHPATFSDAASVASSSARLSTEGSVGGQYVVTGAVMAGAAPSSAAVTYPSAADFDHAGWLSYPPPSGAPPSKRSGHTMTLVGGDRIIVIGGYNGKDILGDLGVLNLRTWAWSSPSVSGSGLPPIVGHSADAVPGTSQIIVFGGSVSATELSCSLYVIETDVMVSTALHQPHAPAPRFWHRSTVVTETAPRVQPQQVSVADVPGTSIGSGVAAPALLLEAMGGSGGNATVISDTITKSSASPSTASTSSGNHSGGSGGGGGAAAGAISSSVLPSSAREASARDIGAPDDVSLVAAMTARTVGAAAASSSSSGGGGSTSTGGGSSVSPRSISATTASVHSSAPLSISTPASAPLVASTSPTPSATSARPQARDTTAQPSPQLTPAVFLLVFGGSGERGQPYNDCSKLDLRALASEDVLSEALALASDSRSSMGQSLQQQQHQQHQQLSYGGSGSAAYAAAVQQQQQQSAAQGLFNAPLRQQYPQPFHPFQFTQQHQQQGADARTMVIPLESFLEGPGLSLEGHRLGESGLVLGGGQRVAGAADGLASEMRPITAESLMVPPSFTQNPLAGVSAPSEFGSGGEGGTTESPPVGGTRTVEGGLVTQIVRGGGADAAAAAAAGGGGGSYAAVSDDAWSQSSRDFAQRQQQLDSTLGSFTSAASGGGSSSSSSSTGGRSSVGGGMSQKSMSVGGNSGLSVGLVTRKATAPSMAVGMGGIGKVGINTAAAQPSPFPMASSSSPHSSSSAAAGAAVGRGMSGVGGSGVYAEFLPPTSHGAYFLPPGASMGTAAHPPVSVLSSPAYHHAVGRAPPPPQQQQQQIFHSSLVGGHHLIDRHQEQQQQQQHVLRVGSGAERVMGHASSVYALGPTHTAASAVGGGGGGGWGYEASAQLQAQQHQHHAMAEQQQQQQRHHPRHLHMQQQQQQQQQQLQYQLQGQQQQVLRSPHASTAGAQLSTSMFAGTRQAHSQAEYYFPASDRLEGPASPSSYAQLQLRQQQQQFPQLPGSLRREHYAPLPSQQHIHSSLQQPAPPHHQQQQQQLDQFYAQQHAVSHAGVSPSIDQDAHLQQQLQRPTLRYQYADGEAALREGDGGVDAAALRVANIEAMQSIQGGIIPPQLVFDPAQGRYVPLRAQPQQQGQQQRSIESMRSASAAAAANQRYFEQQQEQQHAQHPRAGNMYKFDEYYAKPYATTGGSLSAAGALSSPSPQLSSSAPWDTVEARVQQQFRQFQLHEQQQQLDGTQFNGSGGGGGSSSNGAVPGQHESSQQYYHNQQQQHRQAQSPSGLPAGVPPSSSVSNPWGGWPATAAAVGGGAATPASGGVNNTGAASGPSAPATSAPLWPLAVPNASSAMAADSSSPSLLWGAATAFPGTAVSGGGGEASTIAGRERQLRSLQAAAVAAPMGPSRTQYAAPGGETGAASLPSIFSPDDSPFAWNSAIGGLGADEQLYSHGGSSPLGGGGGGGAPRSVDPSFRHLRSLHEDPREADLLGQRQRESQQQQPFGNH